MKFLISTCALVFFYCPLVSGKAVECDNTDGHCLVNNEVVPKGSNAHGKPKEVDMAECNDRHADLCPQYKAQGECEKNPGWMIINW